MCIPTSLFQFSFRVGKLDLKLEKEGRDQLRHFHPAQICIVISRSSLRLLNLSQSMESWKRRRVAEVRKLKDRTMLVDIGQGGTEGSHYTYFDQDRGVRLDQMRRRISLDKTCVSQRRKHKAEGCRTHVGSIIRLQPSLWAERLDIVSKNLSISMHDPWVGPYDRLSHL